MCINRNYFYTYILIYVRHSWDNLQFINIFVLKNVFALESSHSWFVCPFFTLGNAFEHDCPWLSVSVVLGVSPLRCKTNIDIPVFSFSCSFDKSAYQFFSTPHNHYLCPVPLGLCWLVYAWETRRWLASKLCKHGCQLGSCFINNHTTKTQTPCYPVAKVPELKRYLLMFLWYWWVLSCMSTWNFY